MSSGRHHDYIARIRYSNALPPPPFAPKLLHIDDEKHSSKHYTTVGYSLSLALEQLPNIEIDAELGMKIDLIGLPGVFNDNYAAITLPDKPQPLDPRDRVLLKPPAALGKSTLANTAASSFLRRTEYITAHHKSNPNADSPSFNQPARPTTTAAASSVGLLRPSRPPPRRANLGPLAAANSAAASVAPVPTTRRELVTRIQRSFNLAYPHDAQAAGPNSVPPSTRAERDSWSTKYVKHPTKPSLQLLDSYPILTDVHAFPPGIGSYLIVKYGANPTPSRVGDAATESASNSFLKLPQILLLPRAAVDPSDEVVRRHEQEVVDFKAGKLKHSPLDLSDFTAYMIDGDAEHVVPNLKRKYDLHDRAAWADDSLYTNNRANTEGAYFPFRKLRSYATAHVQGNKDTMWTDSILMSLQDGPEEEDEEQQQDGGEGSTKRRKAQKGAFVYPTMQRLNLKQYRQQRNSAGQLIKEDVPDSLEVTVGDWTGEAAVKLRKNILHLDPQAIFEE